MWQELSSISFCSIILLYLEFPDTCFSRGTTRLMSWPDKEHYLHPLQSSGVFLLLSLVSTVLFSRTGGVLSHRSSLSHRFTRFPLKNLFSLVTLAVFSHVYAATNTGSVKLLPLQDWQNRESFLQHLRTVLPAHFSSHSALSSYVLFAPLALWRLCLFATSGPGLGELPGF